MLPSTICNAGVLPIKLTGSGRTVLFVLVSQKSVVVAKNRKKDRMIVPALPHTQIEVSFSVTEKNVRQYAESALILVSCL